MSKLNGIVKDIVSKKLNDAKQKIHDTLMSKVNDKLNAMKPEVASTMVTTEESFDAESSVESDSDEESDLSVEQAGEGLAPIKKRIDPKDRRDAAKYYRTHKTKIRQQQKKYSKSVDGIRTERKAKKLAKVGKTSTGKRISTITNKVLKK